MPSSIMGGSQGQGSYSSTPQNMQLPAYTGLAPGVAGGLSNIFGTMGPNGLTTPGGQFSPFQAGGAPTQGNVYAGQGAVNPLVAPITPQQQATLGNIGQFGNNQPLSTAFSTVNAFLNPNYAASLATSPQTQSAIQAAIQPVRNAFMTQTIPGLEGNATAQGQRVNGAGGQGSTGFDQAAAIAQSGEQATEAATAGQIANAAYQTGLNITANAPAMAGQLTTVELNNMINTLQAEALPQMTEQYGITAGTQLYQNQLQLLLQSLGLGGQISQPALAYQSQGGQKSSSSPGLLGAFSSLFGGGANSPMAGLSTLFGGGASAGGGALAAGGVGADLSEGMGALALV